MLTSRGVLGEPHDVNAPRFRKQEEIADWPEYPEGHPYEGQTQGEMYGRLLEQNAMGQNIARIVPRWGVIR
jgi:hypothetical protein